MTIAGVLRTLLMHKRQIKLHQKISRRSTAISVQSWDKTARVRSASTQATSRVPRRFGSDLYETGATLGVGGGTIHAGDVANALPLS